jgi:hypothetical protein
MTNEEIAFHKKADAYIELMEAVQARCTQDFLCASDAKIAKKLEAEFGIKADFILQEFAAEDHYDYRTWELVMRAYDKQMLGEKQ